MVVLTAAAVVGMVFMAGMQVSGGYADVMRHGDTVRRLDLGTDTVYTAEYGEMINILQVSGGAAVMIDANCFGGHCLRQGAIMYNGQTIVCLPNRLVIQVRAAAEPEFDAILH